MKYNFKLTKQRRYLLDYFDNNNILLSAEDIFKKNPDFMDLSTIYRNLELFYQNGILIKEYHNNINYYQKFDHHHAHYFICIKCHQKFEIDCVYHAIEKEINNSYNFKIINHNFTLYGYCNNCK